MSDSAPELRQEREVSQTASPTLNATHFDRRQFMFVLGGGLVLSQISCSPTQITIVESAGSQAEGADIARASLPEGTLKLSVTTADGMPVGVLKQGKRILFCIGEDMCELQSVSRGNQSFSLDDRLNDTKVRDAIDNIGLSEDDDLVVKSKLGSLAIDTDAQQRVAEELRCRILQMRAQGVQESTVVIDDVTYALETHGWGTFLYDGAEFVGADVPPRNGGSCSVTVTILLKEEAKP